MRSGRLHFLHFLHFLPLAMLTAAPALAQSGQASLQVPVMEFPEVIRQAIEKNPNIQQAASSISRAETLVQQARGFARPIVVATAGNTTLDNARGFSGGVTQPQNQFAFTASAQMAILAAVR